MRVERANPRHGIKDVFTQKDALREGEKRKKKKRNLPIFISSRLTAKPRLLLVENMRSMPWLPYLLTLRTHLLEMEGMAE